MYGYIYKTTNIVTNKIYIGQKKSDRFLGEEYLGSGVRLKSSIKHYGEENFTVELIDTAETKEELNDKEIFYIELYNSREPNVGYNLARGGDGGNTGCAWNKGLTKDLDCRLEQSEETRLKRSESLKLAYREGRHNIDFTDEVRNKMSEKAKLRPHPPTTSGRKSMTNGVENKMVKPEDFKIYLDRGFYFGKTCSMTAWNKGLTKETDERVKKYCDKRQEIFASGKSIGCYGRKKTST